MQCPPRASAIARMYVPELTGEVGAPPRRTEWNGDRPHFTRCVLEPHRPPQRAHLAQRASTAPGVLAFAFARRRGCGEVIWRTFAGEEQRRLIHADAAAVAACTSSPSTISSGSGGTRRAPQAFIATERISSAGDSFTEALVAAAVGARASPCTRGRAARPSPSRPQALVRAGALGGRARSGERPRLGERPAGPALQQSCWTEIDALSKRVVACVPQAVLRNLLCGFGMRCERFAHDRRAFLHHRPTTAPGHCGGASLPI